MKIRLALTLTISKDPPPTPDGGSTATAPDVDITGCADLERRRSYDTTGIGFQPSEVQA